MAEDEVDWDGMEESVDVWRQGGGDVTLGGDDDAISLDGLEGDESKQLKRTKSQGNGTKKPLENVEEDEGTTEVEAAEDQAEAQQTNGKQEDPSSGQLGKTSSSASSTSESKAPIEPAEDLPDGWAKVQSRSSGGWFYHNKVTGETSWTKPVKQQSSSSRPPTPPSSSLAPAPQSQSEPQVQASYSEDDDREKRDDSAAIIEEDNRVKKPSNAGEVDLSLVPELTKSVHGEGRTNFIPRGRPPKYSNMGDRQPNSTTGGNTSLNVKRSMSPSVGASGGGNWENSKRFRGDESGDNRSPSSYDQSRRPIPDGPRSSSYSGSQGHSGSDNYDGPNRHLQQRYTSGEQQLRGEFRQGEFRHMSVKFNSEGEKVARPSAATQSPDPTAQQSQPQLGYQRQGFDNRAHLFKNNQYPANKDQTFARSTSYDNDKAPSSSGYEYKGYDNRATYNQVQGQSNGQPPKLFGNVEWVNKSASSTPAPPTSSTPSARAPLPSAKPVDSEAEAKKAKLKEEYRKYEELMKKIKEEEKKLEEKTKSAGTGNERYDNRQEDGSRSNYSDRAPPAAPAPAVYKDKEWVRGDTKPVESRPPVGRDTRERSYGGERDHSRQDRSEPRRYDDQPSRSYHHNSRSPPRAPPPASRLDGPGPPPAMRDARTARPHSPNRINRRTSPGLGNEYDARSYNDRRPPPSDSRDRDRERDTGRDRDRGGERERDGARGHGGYEDRNLMDRIGGRREGYSEHPRGSRPRSPPPPPAPGRGSDYRRDAPSGAAPMSRPLADRMSGREPSGPSGPMGSRERENLARRM